MNTNIINWKNLIVTDAEGETWGTLGELVSEAPANLDSAVYGDNGEITEWDGFFLSEEGQPVVDDNGFETLDRSRVDWSGLRESIAALAS